MFYKLLALLALTNKVTRYFVIIDRKWSNFQQTVRRHTLEADITEILPERMKLSDLLENEKKFSSMILQEPWTVKQKFPKIGVILFSFSSFLNAVRSVVSGSLKYIPLSASWKMASNSYVYSVILPVYNEKENLPLIIALLVQMFEEQ